MTKIEKLRINFGKEKISKENSKESRKSIKKIKIMENLNKKTDSVLIQMLQSKPIVLSSSTVSPRTCPKRPPHNESSLLSDDDVLILDEPRRWTKKRRLLGKADKKSLSGGEDDSGTEPGSSSSSSGSPSDGECCECPNDSGCDEEDEEEDEHGPRDKIEELCWQLKENFKENDVSPTRFEYQVSNGQIEFVVFNYLTNCEEIAQIVTRFISFHKKEIRESLKRFVEPSAGSRSEQQVSVHFMLSYSSLCARDWHIIRACCVRFVMKKH